MKVKIVSVMLMTAMFLQFLFPLSSYALTGGPSQPEVQSFEPVDTSEMVDHFTGDFTYNIPLLDVDGYPINIAYNSNITMDQEASIVGLGWNINPGVINRSMRGVPDDFLGDEIKKTFNLRNNFTVGTGGTFSAELIGLPFLGNVSMGVKYNNYRGIGFDFGVTPTLALSTGAKTKSQIGLGITSSSQDGVGVNPSFSVSYESEKAQSDSEKETRGGSFSFGASYNSRSGLKDMTFSARAIHTKSKTQKISNSNGQKGESTQKTAASGVGRMSPLTMSYNFASPSYSPAPGNPMVTYGLRARVGFGPEVQGMYPEFSVNGYFSNTEVATKEMTRPAYGYFYSEATNDSKAILDVNREKDVPFLKGIKNLPVTQFTHDVYSVAGQGVGGLYRPFRSEVGLLYDNAVESYSINGSAGLEVAIGVLGDFKFSPPDLNASFSSSRTGPWGSYEGNNVYNALRFRGKFLKNGYAPLYEPYYMKKGGELTASDDAEADFYSGFRGSDPIRSELVSATSNSHRLVKSDNSPFGVTDMKPRSKRDKRNQMISIYTAEEASALFGTLKFWKRKEVSGPVVYEQVEESRQTGMRKGHHTSVIVVTRPDGVRYVYGIAAYNTKQEEVTFNCSQLGDIPIPKITETYDDNDASVNNNKGLTHAYNKQEIPAYAHSYLLTAIYSPDYVDLTGDGPSNDDFGNYHVIDYWRHTDSYRWRTPYAGANYDIGLEANLSTDQKGVQSSRASYVFGEKELWYVKSISSKLHTADFVYNNPNAEPAEVRNDGWGVQNGADGILYGGLGASNTSSLPYLKGITLRPLGDQQSSGIQNKQVWFEYNYDLCKEAPNCQEGAGKLTLSKLYFTYSDQPGGATDQMHTKGRSTAYVFDYGASNALRNPNYDLAYYDKWGNYKKPDSGEPSNAEFPHVIQDKTLADQNAQCWNLQRIQLPTGGEINIALESDDYAYVQDKPTMQMMSVAGMSPSRPEDNSVRTFDLEHLYFPTGTAISSVPPYNYLVVRLQPSPAPIDGTTFKKKYIRDITRMFFDFKVKLNNDELSYNAVKGYADIDPADCGVFTQDSEQYGYIKLKPVEVKVHVAQSTEANPIARDAWNLSRLQAPHLVYPGYNTQGKPLEVILSLLTLIPNLAKAFDGAFTEFIEKGYSSTFNNERSWVRLYCPNKTKYGGGSRVKSLTVKDNWNAMVVPSGKYAVYGHEFDYSITEKDPDGGEGTITYSSGVACYEPLIGNEENPWRQPIYYDESVPLGDKFNHYLETPIGESYFPSASVGYSKVTVRAVYANAETSATVLPTGYSVHEYYTSKDFPTRVRETPLETKRDQTNPFLKALDDLMNNPFGSHTYDHMGASQGYSIELNDMHGKPKSQKRYRGGDLADDRPYSGVEYIYRMTENGSLNNACLVAHPDGSVDSRTVGVDMETVGDVRSDITHIASPGIMLNLDVLSLLIALIPVPGIYPTISTEDLSFRSCVMTKVVNRCGLLEKTKAWQEGSVVYTENLVLDSETGEVVLSRTQNEFGDWIYNFTQPAHWVYDAMGHAYRNEGAELACAGSVTALLTGSSGLLQMKKAGVEDFPSLGDLGGSNFFVAGDELLGWRPDKVSPKFLRLWVLKSEIDAGKAKVSLIDEKGKPVIGDQFSRLKIVRSGRRNQPSSSVGQITTLKNPLEAVLGAGDVPCSPAKYRWNFNVDTWVTEAQAVEYAEEWSVPCCGLGSDCIQPCQEVNPYLRGMRGNWRMKRSHAYLTERRSDPETLLKRNVRYGGTFREFDPFWELSTAPGCTTDGSWSKTGTLDRWRRVTESLQYNQNGVEIENRDALDRRSSALYSYGHRLPVAVSTNAAMSQIAFDGFEDYNLREGGDRCNLRPHFALRYKGAGNFDPLLAEGRYIASGVGSGHTGSHALFLGSGYSAYLDYRLGSGALAETTPLVQRTPDNAWVFKTDSLNDCLPLFSPSVPGSGQTQRYVVSAWTYVAENCSTIRENPGTYGFESSLRIDLLDGCNVIAGCSSIFTPKGPIIEGWQRIEGVFTLQSPCSESTISGLRVSMHAPTGSSCKFDDLRIHPFNSTMKSYVFDPVTLRLVAELDENNYATFFEYDDEGKLVRKKKETERGIVTLQESRRSLHKKPTE